LARPTRIAAVPVHLPGAIRAPGPGRPDPVPRTRSTRGPGACRRPGGGRRRRRRLRVERAGVALVERRGAGMILDVAQRRADLTPERPAVWWDERWLDYAELNRRASRAAAVLASRGIAKGDRVAILAHNAVAHIDLILATAKLGFVYAPLNVRLSVKEQGDIGAYLDPALVLCDEDHREAAEAAAHAAAAPLLSLDDYEAALASPVAASPAPDPDLGPEDVQMILLTGGTTGVPKGAMLPYRQGFYNAVNTVLSWGLRDDDVVIQATPCYHAAVNAL